MWRALTLLALLAALPLAARERWLRIASPNFELLTETGEPAGRDLLDRLERIHAVFSSLAGPDAAGGRLRGTPLPVRVYVFQNEGQFRRLRPSEVARGFYQSAPQRDSIAVLDGPGLTRALYHEYIHLVLNHSTGPLPKWFEEGVAEFYSTLEIRGGRVRLGAPIDEHLRVLARGRWLDGGALAAVRHGSREYNEASRAGVFYAQSWALVHMLYLDPELRPRLPVFVHGLVEGNPQWAAFEEAFGRTMDAALDRLRTYLARPGLPAVEFGNPAAPPRTGARAEPLSEPDATLAIAELALEAGRGDEAERLYKDLARRRPGSPQAATGLGALALSARRYDEARRHLERALELGSRDAATWFEYAILLRETGAPQEDARAALEKALALNPLYAEAHFLLALMEERAGRFAEAVERLKKAVEVFPRQSSFWHALAVVQARMGDRQAARESAQRALESAANELEAERARAALTGSLPQPRMPSTGPAVVTPPAWSGPKGDSRIEGSLTHIDCLGQAARLWIEAGGRRTALWVENPGEVLLKNITSITFEFRCGAQTARAVAVEYNARPDAQRNVAGAVVSIEFR